MGVLCKIMDWEINFHFTETIQLDKVLVIELADHSKDLTTTGRTTSC
jgi:hypothetical protein